MFHVEARDELGNVDTSPASVSWTVDTMAPRRPSVRGPRKTRSARPQYLFLASDAIDSQGELKFLCSLDRRQLRSCTRTFRPLLRPGPHVLRVAAVDRAGNRSATTAVRLVPERR